ncbi:unnamed protein product [Rotaria sordida]|uniref:Staphylococcal nuclease domain-containing protein n=1 Tax=Rotaria sordida TaxID=392033 RepID=A0A814KWX1_9BILA|nr:unnamed protein product [Rotaria sordida]CAF1308800.1 unnamed protein product [Rotaria sordida]
MTKTTPIRYAIVKSIISAPKLSRPPTNSNTSESSIDEPYAFEAREYLRKRLVDREICYTIDFHITQTNRSLCTVYLGRDKETDENIIESLLSEGLVELRQQTDARANDANNQRLVIIDEQAKLNRRGRYSDESPNAHIRNMKWTLENPKQFVDKHKSSPPLDAIVEFIRDGNTVRCLLIPSYYLVTIQLSGIKYPMLKRDDNSTNELYAEEAKQYVETRLLQRQVKAILDGVNNQNLLGTLLRPNGNIAIYLLKEEKYAKDNRLKIWQNYIPQPALIDIDSNTASAVNSKSNDSSLKGYQAKILEIVNCDVLTIRDLRDNKIKKIYLSSVRSPLNNNYPEKIYCTVYIENVNIGEVLISKGFAKAIRYRQDNEQRSSRYDDLLIPEQQAEKRSVCLFSNGSGLYRIVDMIGDTNKERAKGLLNILQRNGRMDGVVEFVASGSRFRIHLLKDNWIMSFLLSSINCPRVERRIPVSSNSQQQQKIESDEPFGIEALNFSKEHFLQRDIFVEVESMDRGSHFIGRLTTTDGQSVALILVQAGLAKIHNSAYNASNYKQLLEAEEKCRKEHIGIWTNYEESSIKENEYENERENNPENENIYESDIINFTDPRFRDAFITYITSDLKIYLQYSEHGRKLEQLQSELREIFNRTKPIAARFTADNEWYRARVEKIEGNNRISIYFVDYGNREIITDLNHLTTLPPGFSQLNSQAHEYELAYVRASPDEDDRQETKNALLDEIGNNECLIKVEYRQNNIEYISLYYINTKENIVKKLVEQGLIIIEQERNRRQIRSTLLYDELQQAQTIAKVARRGLWQYSDQIEDDATEFGFTGPLIFFYLTN